ncbi:MAG: methionine synthase [Anaerolineae bacterium]|nr:methionine synthase [Anaerolineae bacterium]
MPGKIYTNRRYLDAIADHVVVFDGAMGTTIQTCNLTAADFGGDWNAGNNDYLVVGNPGVIEGIHAAFLAAGAEVIETDTFRANRITQKEYNLAEKVVEINRIAAQLARRVADRFEAATGVPRFVAGSMGPTGKLPSANDPELSNVTFDELADVFAEQARGLVEGGADLLLIETSQDILEVRAAITGINCYFDEVRKRIPLQVQVTLDTTGRMLLGTDIEAVLATLEALPVDVIGLNCSTGPEHMREPVRFLTTYSTKPISILPNAGLPLNVDGETVYPMQPEPFARMMAEFVDWGVNVVGGCCGATPAHIRKLVELTGAGRKSERILAQKPGGEITVTPKEARPYELVSSGMRAVALIQYPPPTLIGERVNSQGSRKIKELLLAEDYDGILQVARDQVEGGAHILDVCVALTERADEAEQMRRVVKMISLALPAPLMIDSTEPEVVDAALKTAPGRCIINSINLENGRVRIDKVLPIAMEHGAALVALTIDEQGMAKTAARKLEIAKRIYEICVNEYGLPPGALIFDALTFTLATGDPEFARSAIETMEGIRRIKAELPGALASLGVSNVSFGLRGRSRYVLNSVFLYHCVQAGLDMAIVNPTHVIPYAEIDAEQRALADDLIFARREDALPRYIQYFEARTPDVAEAAAADPTAGMSAEAKIHWQIVHRTKEGVEALIDEALTRKTPVEVINTVLLPAMKEVGDRFGAGELILPFVLQSAEVMKRCVAHVEQFLDRAEGVTKGKVVLATVYGDVHDIGKNLVKTILSNNGYTVFDLGKQAPAKAIIDKAVEVGADAIGLSALLVSTSKQMPLIVNELARRKLEFPVLIGGAAINRRFGRRILFLENTGEPYAPGVFYCKDAFEGLETVEALRDSQRRAALLARIVEEARAEMGRELKARPAAGGRSGVLPAASIPKPPFWGARTVREMPLEAVFAHIHKPELFRLSWGAKNTRGEAWETLEAEFEARLARMQREARAAGDWLNPQAVYGYFPAQSDGDDLVIYDPQRYTGAGALIEVGRFHFPRQPANEQLCLSDYFAPVESGRVDVAPLQVATVGQGATARFDALHAADGYTEAYFFHGLAVQTAEATAEYLHRHVRRELGLPEGQGKRYSWGYPACPDLDDHRLVFDLLPAEKELGMSLTAAYQLVPEQSTAAIVVHHPDAKYYSAGVDRTEQLIEASS